MFFIHHSKPFASLLPCISKVGHMYVYFLNSPWTHTWPSHSHLLPWERNEGFLYRFPKGIKSIVSSYPFFTYYLFTYRQFYISPGTFLKYQKWWWKMLVCFQSKSWRVCNRMWERGVNQKVWQFSQEEATVSS